MSKILTVSICGIIGGILAAVTYVAAYDTFNTASALMGKDPKFFPVITTLAVLTVYFGCLISYKYLESFANGIVRSVMDDMEEEDEEE